MLPDDLDALAAQLSDDANHLTSAYPASLPDSLRIEMAAFDEMQKGIVTESSRSIFFKAIPQRISLFLARVGTAAAILVLASAAWYSLDLPWFGGTQQQANSLPVQNSSPSGHTGVSLATSPNFTPVPPNAINSNSLRPMIVPVSLFERFNAPEQEALLDLMKSHGAKESPVTL